MGSKPPRKKKTDKKGLSKIVAKGIDFWAQYKSESPTKEKDDREDRSSGNEERDAVTDPPKSDSKVTGDQKVAGPSDRQQFLEDYLCNVWNGDTRVFRDNLPDQCVQVLVTSPPYHGLRNYGLPPDEYECDPNCDHDWGDTKIISVGRNDMVNAESSTIFTSNSTKWEKANEKEGYDTNVLDTGRTCKKCGGWLGCLGGEEKVEDFCRHLASTFDGDRRVLRDDGIMLVNMGYAYDDIELVDVPGILKEEMRKRGWVHIKQIIWNKTSFMPEPGHTRPVSSYEAIHMFVKNKETSYWFHSGWPGLEEPKGGTRKKPTPDYVYIDKVGVFPDTLKEPTDWKTLKIEAEDIYDEADAAGLTVGAKRWKRRNMWEGKRYYYDWFGVREEGVIAAGTVAARSSKERASDPLVSSTSPEGRVYTGTRNMRDVWTFAPGRNTESHFAVFPEELPRRAIRMGSSPHGSCADCGAPYERILHNMNANQHNRDFTPNVKGFAMVPQDYEFGYVTMGWSKTCDCKTEKTKPCVVMEPFLGSGTTAWVAEAEGRAWLGCELNPEFAEMAQRNIQKKRDERGGRVVDHRRAGLFEFEGFPTVSDEKEPEDPDEMMAELEAMMVEQEKKGLFSYE
jgi:DNA modification methylase